MPSDSFLAQFHALTAGVGFTPLSRTLLALTGPDRTTFLNAFCTNNIKALVPGRGCEAFITSPQGKTLGHVLVFCEAEQLILDTSPGQAADLIAHFDKYVISEDIQFKDLASEFGDILVAGPSASALLARLTGSAPPTEMLAHLQATLATHVVTIRRVGYTGHASYFMQAPLAAQAAIEQALAAVGATRCDSEAIESARLEAGFPLFGRDITEGNLPQEVGRDAQAISFTKGCYLGQETVARIDALGHVNRQLVGVKLAGGSVPAPGTLLRSNDKEAGHITSAAWSPALSAPIALAYVRRPLAKPGTQLSLSADAAEVITLPVASR